MLQWLQKLYKLLHFEKLLVAKRDQIKNILAPEKRRKLLAVTIQKDMIQFLVA